MTKGTNGDYLSIITQFEEIVLGFYKEYLIKHIF